MSHAPPCTSPWIDYTDSHRGIREELENAIDRYVAKGKERGNEKFEVPVIVAPFGSGKSTLLRHILCYSLSRGIPAVKVNLLDFVAYLQTSTKGQKIPENNLPDYLEQFCDTTIKCLTGQTQKRECPGFSSSIEDEFRVIGIDAKEVASTLSKFVNNSEQRCVLLIDEVEEGYGKLKDIVMFETTPFRGVFDKVSDGITRVFPILAFGPTSIYSEAVSGAGSWRVRPLVLPLISPLNIEGVSTRHFSNLIWWIGKGRPGHVHKVLQTKAVESVQKALRECKSILSTDFAESVKGTFIVSGIPYIDRMAFTGIERSLKEDEIRLFYLLSSLVGPVPESDLKNIECLNVEKVRVSKLSEYFVKSDRLVKVDDVLQVIESALRKLGHEMNDFEKDLLRVLFLAWSGHDNKMLLDERGLTELIDIAKDMAVEHFTVGSANEGLVNALGRLDVRTLYKELSEVAEPSGQFYYALSPSTLSQIYPPVLVNPLIGCAKEKSLNELKEGLAKVDVTKLLEVSRVFREKLMTLIKQNDIKSRLSEFEIVFVSDKLNDDETFKREVKALLLGNGTKGVILIPMVYGQNPDIIINKVREAWQKYERLGLVGIADNLSARISLFLLSFIYNTLYECNKDLDDREKNIYNQFMNVIAKILDELAGYMTQKRSDIRNKIVYGFTTVSREMEADYEVGRDWAKFLLLLAGSDHRGLIEEYLSGLITEKGSLRGEVINVNEVVSYFKSLIEVIDNLLYGKRTDNNEKSLTSGFGQLLEKGWGFYNDLKKGIDDAYRFTSEYLDDLVYVIKDLFVSVQGSLGEVKTKKKNEDSAAILITMRANEITRAVIGQETTDSIAYPITWRVLLSMDKSIEDIINLEEYCSEKIRIFKDYESQISKLKDTADNSGKIVDNIKKLIGITDDIEVLKKLDELKDILYLATKTLGEILTYADKCGYLPNGLSYAENLLLLDFSFKIYGKLMENIFEKKAKEFNLIIEKLDNISSLVNSIKTYLEKFDLKKINDRSLETLVNSERLRQDLSYDIRTAFLRSNSLPDLSQNLSTLSQTLSSLYEELQNFLGNRGLKSLVDTIMNKIEELSKS